MFKLENTTIWSFKDRGSWATHNGSYRGNWTPFVPRNLILRYSEPGDWILDAFLGGGTTLIECKLLNRNAIGVDVNDNALKITNSRLNFKSDSNAKIYLKKGDARNLSFLKNDSIDLICTHPPYADAIKYSENIPEDLSQFGQIEFLNELEKVAYECYRVLKKGKHCCYMIGDIRRNGNNIPLGFYSLQKFLNAGFKLKEIIIKQQHNCKGTKFWENKSINFLLLAHEYIFVLFK